jgi:hypothetical protein
MMMFNVVVFLVYTDVFGTKGVLSCDTLDG